MTIANVYDEWKDADAATEGAGFMLYEEDDYRQRYIDASWNAIRAHAEERCVWTLEASDAVPRGHPQFFHTDCQHDASQHDDRGDWCTWCGKRIEIKEAESAR